MTSALIGKIIAATLVASSVLVSVVACSSGEASEGEGSADGAASDAPPLEQDGEPGDAGADVADAEPRTCSLDNVCQTALPPSSFLRDIWSAGDGIVWAAGWMYEERGTLFRWDGSAWAVQFKTEGRLFAVWGSSPTDIWVGGDGGLFHGTGPSSAAMTFTNVVSKTSQAIASIWGANANDIWAVSFDWTRQPTYEGKVLHYRGPSADGGNGWEIDPISSRPAAFRKVWGTSASDVWLGTTEASSPGNCDVDIGCERPHAMVLRGRPDGHGAFTWSNESMPNFSRASSCTSGEVYRGGDFSGGGSIGAGSVWLMGNLTNGAHNDVVMIGAPKTDGSGNYGWSEHTFGTCIAATGAGPCATSSVYCPGIWFNRAVWGTNPNDVYLAGDFGQLRHWDGASFSRVRMITEKLPATASFYAMWGTSSDDLWIVGDETALHKVAPR